MVNRWGINGEQNGECGNPKIPADEKDQKETDEGAAPLFLLRPSSADVMCSTPGVAVTSNGL